MRKTDEVGPWVVYQMTLWGKVPGANAVCEQDEWDAMERARPGYHTLVREGITSEPEAERLARESPGGTVGTAPRLKARDVSVGGR